jgi:hypothetical protein
MRVLIRTKAIIRGRGFYFNPPRKFLLEESDVCFYRELGGGEGVYEFFDIIFG